MLPLFERPPTQNLDARSPALGTSSVPDSPLPPETTILGVVTQPILAERLFTCGSTESAWSGRFTRPAFDWRESTRFSFIREAALLTSARCVDSVGISPSAYLQLRIACRVPSAVGATQPNLPRIPPN